MNYIILDMEWDSVYHPLYKRFVNQILQIGAVKLDSKFNIVDTFEVTIKSAVSKRLSKRFTELTGITKEMMLNGIPLSDAVSRYNAWIGEDTVTMTWSNSDLFTILENQKYLLKGVTFKIDKYLDLQRYIQGEMALLGHECKSQIALGSAAEILGITTEGYELHTAKDDSLLCAALLKKHYCEKRFEPMIKDTANPEFYRRLCYKPFYIDKINDTNIDKSELRFNCENCGEKLKRLTKWRFHNRNFTADFYCNTCFKKYICRVSFKKTYDDVVVKRHIKVKAPKEKEDAVSTVPKEV